jgi:histidinol-phosphate aminotransferase
VSQLFNGWSMLKQESNTVGTITRVRLRPEIERLAPYNAGPQEAAGSFQLAGNENPFAPLPNVLEAMTSVSVSRYPDPSSTELRAALAARYALPFDGVHVSSGSVSILYEMVRALAGPGDEIVMSWRSFEAYPIAVIVAGATSVQVPNNIQGGHDLIAMAAAITDATRMVLVCSPNNPTGNVVSHESFMRFMERVPASVVVALDEAYVEYVRDPSAVSAPDLLDRYPNLVILRTFSKAYGLAGLRIGYAMGDPAVMAGLRATAIPFAVTAIAQAAALASLREQDALTVRVDAIVALREHVVQRLRCQGWDVPAAEGNFVWLPAGELTALAAQEFRSCLMLVRAFSPDGIRVTIAEPESIEPMIATAGLVRQLLRG